MDHRHIVVVFLTLLQAITVCGEYCYGDNTFSSLYCAYGCCGTSVYQYCCSNIYSSYSGYSSTVSSVFSIGTIVGIAVGSFAGLVLVIVAIVLICKKCTAPTRVVNVIGPPAQGGAVMTQTSGMMSQGGPPGYFMTQPSAMMTQPDTPGQVLAYNPKLYGY
ncbi:unnamed protein product [Lymnaea stagnalis]|uniref:Cysteine and tyrosine-rich protein 1 n=1 Tax=Lymnaea stagnalis TaxID=6523 RepID=A0AAV2HH66_LYMST